MSPASQFLVSAFTIQRIAGGCLFYEAFFFLYSHIAAAVASRQPRTVSESDCCKSLKSGISAP